MVLSSSTSMVGTSSSVVSEAKVISCLGELSLGSWCTLVVLIARRNGALLVPSPYVPGLGISLSVLVAYFPCPMDSPCQWIWYHFPLINSMAIWCVPKFS